MHVYSCLIGRDGFMVDEKENYIKAKGSVHGVSYVLVMPADLDSCGINAMVSTYSNDTCMRCDVV